VLACPGIHTVPPMPGRARWRRWQWGTHIQEEPKGGRKSVWTGHRFIDNVSADC